MERFYIDNDKLNESKAIDVYRDICVELIEQNGLKNKAKEISLKIINKQIEDEKPKDKLTSLYWTLLQVRNYVKNI